MGKIGGFTNLLNYDIKLTSKILRIQYLRHPAIWKFWKSSHSPKFLWNRTILFECLFATIKKSPVEFISSDQGYLPACRLSCQVIECTVNLGYTKNTYRVMPSV